MVNAKLASGVRVLKAKQAAEGVEHEEVERVDQVDGHHHSFARPVQRVEVTPGACAEKSFGAGVGR